MVAEEIWRGLTAGRSVHLQNWPDSTLLPKADVLVAAMDQVREVSSVALSLRKTNSLRVRLPLSKLTVVTQGASELKTFSDIIAEELNVKTVNLVELSLDSATEFGIIKRLSVNARAAGPRLGKNVQAVIQAAKAGDWSETGGKVVAGGVELVEGEYDLDLVADFAGGVDDAPTDLIGILASGGFIILDGKVTQELAAEGLARDTVRAIQQARKDAGFEVSDRINLTVTADEGVLSAVREHEALVCAETLALEITYVENENLVDAVSVGDGQSVQVSVVKR
jgi:isoleucyl-tRNA synthetase